MKLEEIFVSKLVSQDPDEFRFWGLSRAIAKYGEYCNTFGAVEHSKVGMKSFDEWLLTEI